MYGLPTFVVLQAKPPTKACCFRPFQGGRPVLSSLNLNLRPLNLTAFVQADFLDKPSNKTQGLPGTHS